MSSNAGSTGEDDQGSSDRGTGRSIPVMRSGRAPLIVQVRDNSFQSTVTSLLGEVYRLAIKHVQLSGRSHPHPKDIQCALKVALLPCHTYHSTMHRVSHIENLETMQSDEEARLLTINSMAMAGRLMGKMSVDEELGNEETVVNQCRTLQKEEAEKYTQEQSASLFPKTQKMSGSQVAAAIGTIGSLLQASDMPESAAEDFSWCNDEVQEKHNDMFLMERADELWTEYLTETDENDREPFENAMIAAIGRVDQQYAEAEARARTQWEMVLGEEEDREEDQEEDQ